jgi:hypothetical protein
LLEEPSLTYRGSAEPVRGSSGTDGNDDDDDRPPGFGTTGATAANEEEEDGASAAPGGGPDKLLLIFRSILTKIKNTIEVVMYVILLYAS